MCKVSGERLDNRYTIDQYGLADLEELLMIPEDEERVKSLLTKTDKKSFELGSRTIHQQYLISGYLYIRRSGTIRMPKKSWCVLKDDVIYYFLSPKDKEPKGLIELNKGKITFSDALTSPTTSSSGAQQQQQQQQQQQLSSSTGSTPSLPSMSSPLMGPLPSAAIPQAQSGSLQGGNSGSSSGLLPLEASEGLGGLGKDKKLKLVFSFRKSASGSWTDVFADSGTEARNWYIAISTRSVVSSESGFQELLRTAKISGYVSKREGNTHITNKRFAFIADGSLYLCHTQAVNK